MIAQPLYLSRPPREADALAQLLARIEQELGNSQTYAQAIASLQGLLGQAAPDPEPSSSRAPQVQTVDVVSVDLSLGQATIPSACESADSSARPSPQGLRQPVTAPPSATALYDEFIAAGYRHRAPDPERTQHNTHNSDPQQPFVKRSAPRTLAMATVDLSEPLAEDLAADRQLEFPNGAVPRSNRGYELSRLDEAPTEWLVAAQSQPGAIGVWPLPEPQPCGLSFLEDPYPDPNPFDSAVDLLERLFELPSAVVPRPAYFRAHSVALVFEAQPSTIPVDEAWRRACEVIGQRLQAARLAKGWSLERLYATTFVPQHHIESLEGGQIDRLPEPIYVRGFVRRLAEALELDSTALLAELPKGSVASLPHWQVLSGNEPLGLVRPWHVYAGYVAVVAGGVGWMAQSAVAPLVPPLKPTVIDRASYVPPATAQRSQREFQKLPTGEALETFVAPPEVLTP